MKLNKFLKATLLVGLLTLSACGTTTTGGTTTNTSINKVEVLEKVMKGLDEQKSSHVKMVSVNDIITDGVSNKSETNIDMKVILSPVQAEGTVTIASGTQNMSLKMYVKDDYTYVNIGSGDTWFKAKNDSSEFEAYTSQANTTQTLNLMKKFEKDVTVSESGNNYNIKFEKTEIEFKEIYAIFKETGNLGENDLTEEQMKEIVVEKISVNYVVDKKTYDASTANVELIIKQKSNSANKVHVKTDVTYSDLNKVTEIKVPQEVLDKAVGQ